MSRPAASLLLLPFLAAPVAGQAGTAARAGTLGLDDPPFPLPLSRPAVSGDADHAVVAVNSRGDVCVAWHTVRLDLGGNPAQVEAAILERQDAATWLTPSTRSGRLFLLGDPEERPIQGGPAYEACRKPDVVAVGEGFVVAWPRTPLGSNTAGVPDTWLEYAWLHRDPAGRWLASQRRAGVGWLLDNQVSNGEGGVMPDLAAHPEVWPDRFFAVYVHASSRTGSWREFTLRLARADVGGSPPPRVGLWTLDVGIPFDLPPGQTSGPPGGKVLPDAVFLDDGRLAVAYEIFARAWHPLPSYTPKNDTGRIVLERWDLAGPGAPALLDQILLPKRGRSLWERRPNLATSRHDRPDSLSIAWMEEPLGGGDVDVHHRQVEWTTAGPQVSESGFPNPPAVSHRLPVPVHGDGPLRLCLASEGTGALPRRLVVWDPLRHPSGLLPLLSGTRDEWRPATALLDNPALPPQVLAIVWESPTGPAGEYRIQLILRIP